jgi:hypothetical protein
MPFSNHSTSTGEDETEQLQCMMEVLNVPSKDIIDRASRRKLFFDSEGEPRITPNSNGKLRVPGGDNEEGRKCFVGESLMTLMTLTLTCMFVSLVHTTVSPFRDT